MTVNQRISLVKSLGVTYFRPNAPFVDRSSGSCDECEAAAAAGLKLILTVRANGGGQQPTSPPADLAAYQRGLADILNRYPPAILVVENEENSSTFYTGTPEQYGAQLGAACETAHARGIPCANGGLVSTMVAFLVYDDYLQKGLTLQAASFASRAFTPWVQSLLGTPEYHSQVQKGKALLAQDRAAGVDFLNFHWYINDSEAFGEAVSYLRGALGVAVICNEMGQYDTDPSWVTGLLQAVLDQRLPVAVWYSVDATKAIALMNPDATLRPNGVAFQQFVRDRFPPPRGRPIHRRLGRVP